MIKSLSAFALIFILVVVFFQYRSKESCNLLTEISVDEIASKTLKRGIIQYINNEEVIYYLTTTAGKVFSLSEIGVKFPDSDIFEAISENVNRLEFYVESSVADQSYNNLHDILKVGIGYSRSYISFNVIEVDNRSNKILKLSEKATVICQ